MRNRIATNGIKGIISGHWYESRKLSYKIDSILLASTRGRYLTDNYIDCIYNYIDFNNEQFISIRFAKQIFQREFQDRKYSKFKCIQPGATLFNATNFFLNK